MPLKRVGYWLNWINHGHPVRQWSIARDKPKVETRYETVQDEQLFQKWLKRLEKADLIAFDTETTSLNYMQAELVGVSFAVEAHQAAYVPVAHQYPGAPEQLSRDWVLQQLKPLLENEKLLKVGQNLKYDMSVLARYGISMKGMAYDTMLESYVLDSTATRHNMDALAEKYLDHKTIHFEDIAGKGAKQLTFDQIDLEQAGTLCRRRCRHHLAAASGIVAKTGSG